MSPVTAVHTLLYSDDAAATRRFLREVLRFPFVVDGPPGDGTTDPTVDPDAGWLVFGTGPSELGVHPTAGVHEGRPFRSPRHHQIAFLCADLDAAMAEISGRGGVFASGPDDAGWDLTALLEVPGADPVLLYQPRHATAHHL